MTMSIKRKIKERNAKHPQYCLVPKVTPITLACSSLLLLTGAAFAQQSEPQQSVVVTGIRASIESSLAIKKGSDSIVEVVSAEDIGKLPDLSIAESLARLPGVAAQRVDGRAQVLSIRGMAPSFGVTLLNGSEMVSTGDDRSFEYDQFPSELVSSATVYKTPDSALGTQGLSGTVNLMTVHPLDFKERKLNLNARLEKNTLGNMVQGSSGSGDRLSASYIDQFADHTIGVAFGFARLNSPSQQRYFSAWDFGSGDYLTKCCGTVDGLPGATLAFDGLEAGVASTQATRDGFLAVLEYKPSKDFHSQFDLFSSQFKQKMNGRELIAYWSNWSNGTTPNWSALANSNYGGTISNITPFVTTRQDKRDDKVNAIGWNTLSKLGAWTLTTDLSYSKATRHEFVGEAYATSPVPTSIDVSFAPNLTSFGKLSSPFNFANAANFQLSSAWWGGGGYGSVVDVNDKMKTARVSARRELDWGLISSIDAGVIYSERSKDLNDVGTNYNLNSTSHCNVGVCSPIPASILQSPVNMGFAGIPGMISFGVQDAFNSGAYSASPSDPKSPSWNWGVNEKVTTAFSKFNLDFQAGIPVHGNFGVQFVNVHQRASGLYDDNNGTLQPSSGGKDYSNVLPSLNLIGDLGKDAYLRLGIAKQVARPNLADMRAGTTASVSQTDRQWYGGGGNPELQPWRANAFDLSLEKYYGKSTYVAAAAYEKQITSGIITKDVKYDFSKFTNPTAFIPVSNMGTMTTPTNTSGGYVRGWELSGSLGGEMISNALDGFGLLGSYSHASSNLPGTDSSGAATSSSLDGLSGNVWGITAYYEKAGFQVRLAQRYRSAFSATRHNAFKFVVDTIRPEKINDFQIGYEIQAGQLKGLGVLFQINNMSNTPYVTTQTVDGVTALKEFHQFGRQYLLGLNYKM
jgi:iron complex outermembrane receptor protein